jgi:hypothetical protein
MNILALDLGTNTGWARRLDGKVVSGTWSLPPKKKGADCCVIDPRLILFRQRLRDNTDVDALVYEDVKFVRSQAQAHLWAGFRAVLWLFAHDFSIPTFCCPVQTLKKFATGSGAADKDAMALAYYEKVGLNPRFAALDDNAIDAWHLLHWAEATLTKPEIGTP